MRYFLLGSLFILGTTMIVGCTEEKRAERKEKKEKKKSGKDEAIAPEDAKPIEGQEPLQLTISNLGSPDAEVRVAFYTPKNDFLNQDDVFKRYKFKPEGSTTLKVDVKDLPYGEYALVTFQDVDGNGEINRTKIGVPEEPYAFSKNVKPGMSKPDFGECKFTYSKESHSQEITMMRKGGDEAAKDDGNDSKKKKDKG